MRWVATRSTKDLESVVLVALLLLIYEKSILQNGLCSQTSILQNKQNEHTIYEKQKVVHNQMICNNIFGMILQ